MTELTSKPHALPLQAASSHAELVVLNCVSIARSVEERAGLGITRSEMKKMVDISCLDSSSGSTVRIHFLYKICCLRLAF